MCCSFYAGLQKTSRNALDTRISEDIQPNIEKSRLRKATRITNYQLNLTMTVRELSTTGRGSRYGLVYADVFLYDMISMIMHATLPRHVH